MKLLIVGGSDAGISAALRARELDDDAEIEVLLSDDFPNFSICGLPFFLSGETPDWHRLAHRTEFEGVQITTGHHATELRLSEKQVMVATPKGKVTKRYDRLVLATGAEPVAPPIPGISLPGVFLLHTMQDSFELAAYLHSLKVPARAVIIGAGYIGLEMADALTRRGLDVHLASRGLSVLPSVDTVFGDVIATDIQARGVHLSTNVDIERIEQQGDHLLVMGCNGFSAACEVIIVATGVRPNVALGSTAGLSTGPSGAYVVDRNARTSAADVFAAGDCGETWHRLLGRNAYLPLGTTAHKQGRVAGANAAGSHATFAGSLGTQVVKIFDHVIARTGLRDKDARAEGMRPFTVDSVADDHKAYYPGAHPLRLRITGDLVTGKLLGAQVLGAWGSEVAKRADIFATALFHEMRVDDISDLDLTYTPPISSPWDPIQLACQGWIAASKRADRSKSLSTDMEDSCKK